MLEKSNKEKILEQFFKFPTTKFELRELSRNVNIAPTSVKNYLLELEKEKLILKKFHRIRKYPLYIANFDSFFYKLLKKQHTVRKLFEIGVIDFIYKECLPDSIILFGSASRGEDTEVSDIDIFVEAKTKHIDYEHYNKFKKWNKELERIINPYFRENFNLMSNELRTNITNGIIIKGFLDIDYGKSNKRFSRQRQSKNNT